MISSNDLDALDELEYLIRDNFGGTSAGYEEVEFFLLKHRDPIQVKAQLTNLIEGPQDSGGGSGNPLLDMGGRALENAAGFNPLDMFGGGGDLGAGGGILPTVGAVVLATDPRVRGIWVRAEAEDMALIAQVIADVIDLPGAPHDVNEIGDTYRIEILHQDPSYVLELVKSAAPSLFESDSGGGGGGDAAQQMQQQMMQQLQRAMQQGLGGGSSAPEEKIPKATLAADTENSALLVTGPEYIARRVEQMVKIIDQPKEPEQQFIDVVEIRGKMDANQLAGRPGRFAGRQSPGRGWFVNSIEPPAGQQWSDSNGRQPVGKWSSPSRAIPNAEYHANDAAGPRRARWWWPWRRRRWPWWRRRRPWWTRRLVHEYSDALGTEPATLSAADRYHSR